MPSEGREAKLDIVWCKDACRPGLLGLSCGPRQRWLLCWLSKNPICDEGIVAAVAQVMAFNAWREGMEVVVRHLHRGDLPPSVLAGAPPLPAASNPSTAAANPIAAPANGAVSLSLAGGQAAAQQQPASPAGASSANSGGGEAMQTLPEQGLLANGKRRAEGSSQAPGRPAKQARQEAMLLDGPAAGGSAAGNSSAEADDDGTAAKQASMDAAQPTGAPHFLHPQESLHALVWLLGSSPACSACRWSLLCGRGAGPTWGAL
jgi:hypothetical protein